MELGGRQMKLSEILEDADLLVPNALTITQKIRYFNQIQKQLYRDYPMPTKSDLFYTEAGVSLYDIYVQPDRVISVYINDDEYTLQDVTDTNQGKVYTFMDGELFIQPPPDSVYEGYILYEGEAEPLTEDELDSEPSLLPDFHELFVYGIAEKLAMVAQDYKTAGELNVRFGNIIQDARRKVQKTRATKTRNVRRWS
jgi:hypothetical protein